MALKFTSCFQMTDADKTVTAAPSQEDVHSTLNGNVPEMTTESPAIADIERLDLEVKLLHVLLNK